MVEASLELVQAMLQRVLDGQDALRRELRDLRDRVGALETQGAYAVTQMAQLSIRMDRMNDRLERIETRLGLIEA